nr:reverse transcriptase domain-containing protein [Tanacetum cinerariifolium]
MIGSTLTEEGRNKLCNLLQGNLDIFAWKPVDMTGIPRHIAEHRLNVQERCSPVRQKKRGQATDRNQAIQEEVEKLLEDVCRYQRLKHNMPKRWLSATRNRLEGRIPVRIPFQVLPGYIQMAIKDKEKTAFITSQGIFCYTKMPIGLRNVGATYQRLVDKAFHKQISRNLKVYVDDLVIKSRTEDEIVRDIEETFKTLRKINMKLNPKKSELPMLIAPIEKEELIVYLAAAIEAVSTIPMTEKVAKQMPIYFVSRALSGLELNYTSMEKLILALVHTREYTIHYRPRVSVKGQILANFIVERPEEDSSDALMEVKEELPEPWILFTDGSSCTDGSGAGLIL